MQKIVTPEEMRRIEGHAIRDLQIPSLLLMERAALALAQEVKARGFRHVLIVCGSGNNGGDGYAAARMLHLWDVDVTISPLCPIEKLKGDALLNANLCLNLGICVATFNSEGLALYDCVVDAIFGTGLSRAPEGIFREAIEAINKATQKVVSVDIPSGIDGATGQMIDCAIQADVTVTFGYIKRGLLLYPGAKYAGEIVCADIGLPESDIPSAEVLTDEDVQSIIPAIPRDAYKNQLGHALLVSGSRGMAGAAVLSATSCSRTGVGLLTVLCQEQSVMPVVQKCIPTAMCLPILEDANHQFPENAEEILQKAANGKTALGIGCGLGRSEDREAFVQAALKTALPALVDADGIYHLSKHLEWLNRGAETVLTPHPGEMAFLLGRKVEDPVFDALTFAQEHSCVVLLKGACTVIAAPDGKITFNTIGTQGMATAGSGDTLTGIILGLLARGLSAYDAARVGAFLHAKAGLAAEQLHGTASMNALDMANCIRIDG